MSAAAAAIFLFGLMLVLLFAGFPVAFVLIGVTIIGYFVISGPNALPALTGVIFNNITTDIYIAIPLFIFMAMLLEVSGIGSQLYEAMYKWMAGLRGGLAMGTILICTIIAATTGLAGTGTVMMGLISYPEMIKRGYSKTLAIGCVPAGGSLGPLIPPSVIMILIGGFASLSVGRLFIGGIVPGLLMAALFIVYIGLRCSIQPSLAPAIKDDRKVTWGEKIISLRGIILPIILIALILGGIYSGACTPTEAGGIGAVGTIICAAINRKLNWTNLKKAISTTFTVNAMIMWLVVGGAFFTSILSMSGVTLFVSQTIAALPLGAMGILIVMMIIVFCLGMFIDSVAIAMITLPIFMPVIKQLGFDPLWFALLFSINLVIGMVTPPFGYTLFFFKGLGHPDVTMSDIYHSVWPYIVPMVIVLILGLAFPQLLLWLPATMIK